MAALIGGVAGALLTGGMTLWLEHRRQRRVLLVAARLVAAELRTIQSRLHVGVASGTWRPLRTRALARNEWDEHRAAFAAHLPAERWLDVQTAYALIGAIAEAAELRGASERLTPIEREELETAAASADAAATFLESSLAAEREADRRARRAHWMLLRHP